MIFVEDEAFIRPSNAFNKSCDTQSDRPSEFLALN